jgi:erythromycin esterase-like protein
MSAPDVGPVSAALARVVRPIEADEDLDALAGRLAEARLVLLGESTHGTREFHELRAALTRRLIAHHGFAALAIDADWPDVLPVDRYVRGQGDDESASAALASFERFPEWRWRNAAFAELVEWLHGENQHRPPAARAGCYGLDLYAQHASIRAVLSYLAEVDPEAAIRARVRYASFDHAPLPRGGLPAPCEDELVEELVEMQRRRSARSGRAPSGEAWFRAIQGTRVAQRAEAYYRALVGGAASAFALREVELADTLDLLSVQLAGAGGPPRIVVWAHNVHVGDVHDPGARQTLAAVLRQRHPGDVSSVGFTTYTGAVACAHEWDGPPEVEALRAPGPGSWEHVLHEVGVPRFVVAAPALRRAAGEHAERPHRAIGAVYRPEIERWNHDTPARLAERYDLVVHVDATSALELLPRTVPEPRDVQPLHLSHAYPNAP